MAGVLSAGGIADLVAKQREKLESRKQILNRPGRGRSLFEVAMPDVGRLGMVEDVFHRKIVALYLVTMRLRRHARHADGVVENWEAAHPGVPPPKIFTDVPQHYLVPDLLKEIVSYIPAVRVVVSTTSVLGETHVTSDTVPHRYAAERIFKTLETAVNASRTGDYIAVKGPTHLPTTLTVKKPLTIYGVVDGEGREGCISAGSTAAYTMLNICDGVVLEGVKLISGGVTVGAVEGRVRISQCDIIGSVLQTAGTLELKRVGLKSGRQSTPYGVYVAGGEGVVEQCSITGFATGIKIGGEKCTVRRTRIKGSTGGAIVVQKTGEVTLQEVDISDLQVASTATVVLKDSNTGPCKILHSGGTPVPGYLTLTHNNFTTDLPPCVTIPPLGNPFNVSISGSVFISPPPAVSLRNPKGTTQLSLLQNTFQQPESTGVLLSDCPPQCVTIYGNSYNYRPSPPVTGR